jgi:hypothetical protein
MNIEEMHASVLLKIDKVGSYSTANLIPGEITDFLNDAQRDFINQNRRFLREYNDERRGVEAHEALRTITEEGVVTSVNDVTDLERGFKYDLTSLPNTYDYFISARAYYSTPDHWKTTRIVNRAFINDRSTTLYHERPVYSETPVHIDNSELIGLYDVEDAEKPSKLAISYVREPQDMFLDPNDSNNNVDSELPEDFHRDIVDIATRKIIGSLAGQQGQNQEN